jgi:hypothetical protein
MKSRKNGSWVLWYECLGFGLLLLFSWLNELLDLPHLLFGGEAHACDFRDSLIESAVIVLIWAVVFVLTKRLVAHLLYLEGFLRVCAWCRKVGYDGQWMGLEEYFARGFHVETTHGMCPQCLRKVEDDIKELHRKEAIKASAGSGPAASPRADFPAVQPPPTLALHSS